MRTTIALDDDVAALLDRVRKDRNLGLKEAVNEALRHGLSQMAQPPRRHATYRARSVTLGRCLVGQFDDISQVLAIAEGQASR